MGVSVAGTLATTTSLILFIVTNGYINTILFLILKHSDSVIHLRCLDLWASLLPLMNIKYGHNRTV